VKPFELSGFGFARRIGVKRILKPVTFVLAALYFLAGAALMAIAKPISGRPELASIRPAVLT
jgi:hypothetical protein